MKKAFLTLAIAGLSFGYVSANTTAENTAVVTSIEEAKKVRVSVEELPEAVLSAYEGSEYAEWQIAEAYQVEEEGATYFELHLTDAAQEAVQPTEETQPTEEGQLVEENSTKVIKIDSEGNMMQ